MLSNILATAEGGLLLLFRQASVYGKENVFPAARLCGANFYLFFTPLALTPQHVLLNEHNRLRFGLTEQEITEHCSLTSGKHC